MHKEMGWIWPDLDQDTRVRVIIVTGAGEAFCAGGSFDLIDFATSSAENLYQVFTETKQLVHNMIDCSKPIISAINGVAVGAGMVVALMADISVASANVRFNDGHTRLGVAAGDHACLIWPLLTSMAKSKLYLFTGRFISAQEAESVGLISMAVPKDQLHSTVQQIAKEILNGPQHAIKFTKLAMNQHLKQAALVSFDYSCALEMLGFIGADVKEGVRAIKSGTKPSFPSAKL